MSYEIRYSDGRVDAGYETIDDAAAAIRESFPELEYGHDGDLEDHGDRTLCWATPEDAEGDDGSSAVAVIYRSRDVCRGTISTAILDDITFHVPPVCQGQTVEYAYGISAECELAILRVTDRSDGSVEYHVSSELYFDGNEWEPWNDEPEATDWRQAIVIT